MKLAAVCALVAVGVANALVAVEQAVHTDQWCADHHLGEGPSTCIQNPGCAYDGRIGICHSAEVHSNEWCSTYGGTVAKDCVQYAGCTFSFEQTDSPGQCESAQPERAATIQDEMTCTEMTSKCEEGEQSGLACEFTPECDDEGAWELVQNAVQDGVQFSFCVDDAGHEIPDTRKKTQQFLDDRINCGKERKKHDGDQCPNAVTLTTGNGQVLINDHEDVGNCDMTCNTDLDCGANEWCCYNGCGYSCQKPIKPQEDCQHLSGLLGDYLGVEVSGLKQEDKGVLQGTSGKHGAEATLRCQTDWNALKDEEGHRTNQVTVTCKHGHWADELDWNLTCKKDCQEYRIDGQGTIAEGGIWHGHHDFGTTTWVSTTAEERDMWIKSDRATFDGCDTDGNMLLSLPEISQCAGFDASGTNDRTPQQVLGSLDTNDPVTGLPDNNLDFEEFDAEYFTVNDQPFRGGAFHTDHEQVAQVGRVKMPAQGATQLAKGYNLANRSRDYIIKGNGLEHGAKRKVMCNKGYGAIAGTDDAMARNLEKVRCVNGAWEPRQTLECSTCFDARHDDFTEELTGNDCVYFASRPMECANSPGAQDNCRIACRTCDTAAKKYKVHAVQKNLEASQTRTSWKYKQMRVKVGHQEVKDDSRQVKVAKFVAKL